MANGSSSFERGWDKAIWLWKDGYTWELITHTAIGGLS